MKPAFCMTLVVMGIIGTSVPAFAQSGWQEDGAMVRFAYSPSKTTYGDEYCWSDWFNWTNGTKKVQSTASVQKIPYTEGAPLSEAVVDARFRQNYVWAGGGTPTTSFRVPFTASPSAHGYAQASTGAQSKATASLKVGPLGSTISAYAHVEGTNSGAYYHDNLTVVEYVVTPTTQLTGKLESVIYSRVEGVRFTTAGVLYADAWAEYAFDDPIN